VALPGYTSRKAAGVALPGYTSRKAAGVARILRLASRASGVETLRLCGLTLWLARPFCGNRECGLRLRTPPPAFRGVFGTRYRVPGSQIRLPSTLPRLVDWVSVRRLHSTLPQSWRANHSVDAVALSTQTCTTASVSQRTDTRSASPPHTGRYMRYFGIRAPARSNASSQQQGWGIRQSEVKEEAEGRGTRTAACAPALLRAQQ
jgi:hypothetical protein